MNILQTTRHRTWLSVLFLIVATVIAYQPVWRAGFIWDDDMFLTNNAVLKSADGLYRLWFTASTPDYFPMTSSMLWCEWRIWGNHALGYHLVNVLLHAFSSVLLWRVLERLKIPRALLAAAIFALHPVNVESVAWITQRKNTLAMFFYVCVFLLYLRFEDTGKRRWYGLASIVFALALLSKTAVVPLPLVLLGIAWWRRGRVAWQDVRRSIVFFMVAAALAVVTIWFQSHRAIGSEVIRTDSFWSRLAGAGWAIWFYLYKAVLPLNLSFVYPLWQIDERKVLSYVPLLLLAAIFGWCWIYRLQWGRALLFGLGYFVVMLLPILGFLDIYFMCFSLVADHWQYFAIIGPIALAAAIIKNNLSATMLLLALGTLSWRQCLIYTDAETLWRTTISRNPDSILANNNFGVMLSDRGQLDDAIAHFQKILKIRSDDPDAHNNFGNALLRKGDVDGAIFHYQEALKSAPHRADVHYNFGNAFVQKGQLDQALVHFQRAWEIKPNYLEAYNNAGSILLKIGRINEAVACWLKALEINPRVALPHNNIGYALVTQGRLDEAIVYFQKALQVEPNSVEAGNNMVGALLHKGRTREAITQAQRVLEIQPQNIVALNNMAWMLATCPDASLRNGKQAVELALQANQLSPAENVTSLQTLAAAYAEAGQFPLAIATVQRALQIAAASNDTSWISGLQAQLTLYQANSPFRDSRLAKAP